MAEDFDSRDIGGRFVVVSFGDGSSIARDLSENYFTDSRLQRNASSSFSGLCGAVKFHELSQIMTADEAEEISGSAEMVILLGSDNCQEYRQSVEMLCVACQSSSAICYAILAINDDAKSNEITRACRQASNLLLIPPDKNGGYDTSAQCMKGAVINIAEILLYGGGIIGTDFLDVRKLLQGGQHVLVGVGRARGEYRAHRAACAAIGSLNSELHLGAGLLCLLSLPQDFELDEITVVFDCLAESDLPEDSLCLISTAVADIESDEFTVRLSAIFSK